MNQHCFVCNGHIVIALRNGINLFSDEVTLQSGKKIKEVLSEIFEKPLVEENAYSKLVCMKCHKSVSEYDSIQVRMKIIKFDLCSNFKCTLQQYGLNYDSYNAITIKSVATLNKDGSMSEFWNTKPTITIPSTTSTLNLKATVGTSVLTHSIKTTSGSKTISLSNSTTPTQNTYILVPAADESNISVLGKVGDDDEMINIEVDIKKEGNDLEAIDEQEMEIDKVKRCKTNAEMCRDYYNRKKAAREAEKIRQGLSVKKPRKKTVAERVRAYRMRKKILSQVNESSVTETLSIPSTSRSRIMTLEPSFQLATTGDRTNPPDVSTKSSPGMSDHDDCAMDISTANKQDNLTFAETREQTESDKTKDPLKTLLPGLTSNKGTDEGVDLNDKFIVGKLEPLDDRDDDGDEDEESHAIVMDSENGSITQLVPQQNYLYVDSKIGLVKQEDSQDGLNNETIDEQEHHAITTNQITGPVDECNQHECTVCKKKYGSRALLLAHMKFHNSSKPYTCDICHKSFSSKYTYQSHLKTHEDRPRPFKCKQCPKSFYTQSLLSQHEKTHSGVKDFVCSVCGKAFVSQYNLDVHGVVHSGNKPFECDVCGKAFARRAEVQDHMRTHTGERPFKCDICGATFTQRSNLHSHKRATHLDDKRYHCEQCPKRFKRRRLLDYHIKASHTLERPLKCDVCEASFVSPEDYKRHKLIHSGTKPYVCEVCGKSFSSRDTRNTHRFIHSDRKAYECLVCGAGFMRKQLLYQHMNVSGHIAETIVVNKPRVMKVPSKDNAETQSTQEVFVETGQDEDGQYAETKYETTRALQLKTEDCQSSVSEMSEEDITQRNAQNCKKYRLRKKAANQVVVKKITNSEKCRQYRQRKKLLAQQLQSKNGVIHTPSTSSLQMTFEPQLITTDSHEAQPSTSHEGV